MNKKFDSFGLEEMMEDFQKMFQNMDFNIEYEKTVTHEYPSEECDCRCEEYSDEERTGYIQSDNLGNEQESSLIQDLKDVLNKMYENDVENISVNSGDYRIFVALEKTNNF